MRNPDATFTSKLGTTRAGERTRIWLEGNRLVAAGFDAEEKYLREWSKNKLVLTRCSASAFEKAERNLRGSVSGRRGRPIIDITGAKVAETFNGDHVTVKYDSNRITIS